MVPPGIAMLSTVMTGVSPAHFTITGKGTVPQVFINGEHIGGWEELERWAKKAA